MIEVKFDDVLRIYEKETCKNTKNKGSCTKVVGI